jgi:sulfatase maturation enzyme AslB (radical SAM superfamily)
MINLGSTDYYISWHCNLKCANCITGSPYRDEEYSDLESFKRDVDNLSQYMHVGVLRLLGGEPTLNPEITEYLKYAKQSKLCDVTAVLTNGVKLMTMPDEFFDNCDIVTFSKYENAGINYEKIFNYLDRRGQRWNLQNVPSHPKSIGVWKQEEMSKEAHSVLAWGEEFRVLDQFEELDEDTAQAVYTSCSGKTYCGTFMDGNYYRCAVSMHRPGYYKAIGVPLPYDLKKLDGIPIDAQFIENYHEAINSEKININACRFCKGYGDALEITNEPHRQLTLAEITAKKVK